MDTLWLLPEGNDVAPGGLCEPLPHYFDARPVVALETQNVRAFISTTYSDQHLGLLCQLCGELLRLRIAEINFNLTHRIHHHRMNMAGRLIAFRQGQFDCQSIPRQLQDIRTHFPTCNSK